EGQKPGRPLDGEAIALDGQLLRPGIGGAETDGREDDEAANAHRSHPKPSMPAFMDSCRQRRQRYLTQDKLVIFGLASPLETRIVRRISRLPPLHSGLTCRGGTAH